MASSMLAAIRAAMSARAEDDDTPETIGSTGAQAPIVEEETDMSAEQRPAAAGISQQQHDDAVRAAEARGAEGERNRIRAATSAEGVAGDGNRFMAAVDLAMRSPTMPGAEVAAFVVANVAQTAKAAPVETQAAHDQRVLGAGLAQPSQQQVDPTSAAGWKKAAAAANARFGDKGVN